MSKDPRDRCKHALDSMTLAINLVRADGHKELAQALTRVRDNFGAVLAAHGRTATVHDLNVVRDQPASKRRDARFKGEGRPGLRKVTT